MSQGETSQDIVDRMGSLVVNPNRSYCVDVKVLPDSQLSVDLDLDGNQCAGLADDHF